MTLNFSPNLLSHHGTFVISLDFELHWGIVDQCEITPTYKEIFVRTRQYVIPGMLELFREYEIHATWATVGLLFFKNQPSLLASLPDVRPSYVNPLLSAYTHLDIIGESEQTDPYHYAPSLIKKIQSYPHQEIGSHTFSHYYCLEEGASPPQFEADMLAWKQASDAFDVVGKSHCFARNQYDQRYIDICQNLDISAYRGNENIWFYRPTSYEQETMLRKIFRWIDTYAPITSHQCKTVAQISKASRPYNITSSRFLRAFYPRLSRLEPLKVRRILTGMSYAAKQKKIYHLWWHPHDFGENTEENFEMLEQILRHYAALKNRYGMNSLNMAEISSQIESHEIETSEAGHKSHT